MNEFDIVVLTRPDGSRLFLVRTMIVSWVPFTIDGDKNVSSRVMDIAGQFHLVQEDCSMIYQKILHL